MVESLQGREDGCLNQEEDDIIKQTRLLLANLRNEQGDVDSAEEESKKNEVRSKMAALGTMFDKADLLRESHN